MTERPGWVGLRLGVRLLRSRSRSERRAVVLLVAGAAVVTVAVTVTVGLLAALSTRAEVVASRSPSFIPTHGSNAPLARVRVLDTGEVEATIIELGPRTARVEPPAGVASWPRAGELWLSPAAAADRSTDPYLDALVQGRPVGTISRDGLRDPEDVVVVMGRSVEQLSGEIGAGRVTGFGTGGDVGSEVDTSQEFTPGGLRALRLVCLSTVALGALALMVGVARVADAARRLRLAALHLMGAPLAMVRAVSSSYAATWSVGGALLGLCVAWPAADSLSRRGLFGVTWWASHSFNPQVAVASVLGVALIAALGGWRSVPKDAWGTRRAHAEHPPSPARLAPLIAGSLLLSGVLVSQAKHRGEDLGTPDRLAVLLCVSAAVCGCGVVLAAPVFTHALARLVGRRSSLPVRVAAARVRHHVRETTRTGFALLVLVLVCGGVLGAASAVSWQSSATTTGDRILELPTVDDLGRPLPPRALTAALEADGVRRAEVQRHSGAIEPIADGGDRRPSDVGYTLWVRPEDASRVAAVVQRVWAAAPPLYNDRDVSAARGRALISGTLLVGFTLSAIMILIALGVALLTLQQGRRAADQTLLAVGMSSRQMAGVRGWEVALAAFPGPTLAAVVSAPIGIGVMHLDHTNVPIPATFALIPLGAGLVVVVLAVIAALLSPRQGDPVRASE